MTCAIKGCRNTAVRTIAWYELCGFHYLKLMDGDLYGSAA